jgi:hypothetical protein
MKRILLGLVLSIAAACGKGGASKTTDECAKAMTHLTALQIADLPEDMREPDRKKLSAVMTAVGGAMAKSCNDTSWPKTVTDCLLALKGMAEGKACDDMLTPAQRDAAEKAAMSAAEEAQKPTAEAKSEALAAITKLRDEMCACKDAACGEAVYVKWGDAEKASEGARHDEPTKVAWEKIDDELMACKAALR